MFSCDKHPKHIRRYSNSTHTHKCIIQYTTTNLPSFGLRSSLFQRRELYPPTVPHVCLRKRLKKKVLIWTSMPLLHACARFRVRTPVGQAPLMLISVRKSETEWLWFDTVGQWIRCVSLHVLFWVAASGLIQSCYSAWFSTCLISSHMKATVHVHVLYHGWVHLSFFWEMFFFLCFRKPLIFMMSTFYCSPCNRRLHFMFTILQCRI